MFDSINDSAFVLGIDGSFLLFFFFFFSSSSLFFYHCHSKFLQSGL